MLHLQFVFRAGKVVSRWSAPKERCLMTNGLLVPDVLDETTASAQRKLEAVGLKIGLHPV
jgi:hypothetical protein